MTREEIEKEITKFRRMPNDVLLDQFELHLRRGAGRLSIPLIWIRQEIIRRLEEGEITSDDLLK